jgi:hypothetical protein
MQRARWTDGFYGDQLGVFRPGERDCECGADRDDVVVLAGWRRGNDTTRRLACGPCGRRWWQISVGD